MSEHSALLIEVKDIVQFLQQQQQSPPRPRPRHERTTSQHSTSEDRADEDLPAGSAAADRNTTSAPVTLIRNRFSAVSGLARLSRDTKDIVELGLLSERQASHLQELFFQKVGPWIGIPNWNAISEARDVRRISPLLFATICLQGGRLDPSFCNSSQHDQLYEHVRALTGRELLISPLPLESVCALLIVGVWSTSPKEKAEFIDSWLMSGYAIQQAMLCINFTALLKRVNEGESDHVDQRKLRLWNMICLCHLQFAVGTGRPSVIAPEYLEHCSAILDTTQATVYDSISVATLQLFAIAQNLLKHSNLTEEHSRRHIRAWTSKWGHILDVGDHRVCILQIAVDFCHLILDRRCLEHYSTAINMASRPEQDPAPINAANSEDRLRSPTTTNSNLDRNIIRLSAMRDRFLLLCKEHAFQLLNTFKSLPLQVAEEIPEFLLLCIVYAMILLAELHKETPTDSTTPQIIRETLEFGQRAVSGTTISFELTAAALGQFLETAESYTQRYERQIQTGMDSAPVDMTFMTHENLYLSLEDIFSGNFSDNYRWQE